MARILVGIATVTPDQRFLESLPVFFREAGKRYDIDCHWVWRKQLYDAQNEIAEKLLEGDYEYLLTIEDDHWGFTAEMLDACLAHDAEVVQISYRNRHFPFDLIPMEFSYVNSEGMTMYKGMADIEGYHEADLAGFGFTLIKRKVFETLDQPFFRRNCESFPGAGPHATDIDFCTRVKAEGMRIVGCFNHRLAHRDVTDESRKRLLVEGILAKHSMMKRMEQIVFKNKLNMGMKEEVCTKDSVEASI